MVLFLLGSVVALNAFITGNYGSFAEITHDDLMMWVFMMLFGLWILIIAGVIFIIGYSWQNSEGEPEIVEVPVEEITEEPVEAAVEEPPEVEIPEEMPTVEEITEEEAPAEVQAQPGEETVDIPRSWQEETFE